MGSLKAALDRVVHPCTAALFSSVLVISSPLCQNNRSLNTKTYCQNVLLCMDNYELADLLWGQLFEPRACCGGSHLKSDKKWLLILSPTACILAKDAQKQAKEPPNPLWRHLFEPGAGWGSDLISYKHQTTPYTITNNLYLSKNALK